MYNKYIHVMIWIFNYKAINEKVKCVFYGTIAIVLVLSLFLRSGGFVQAATTDTVTVDFNNILRPVDHSTFGYILAPNYDIPASKMKMLRPILNLETIPVQIFQGVGDLDGTCFNKEDSQLQRCLEIYQRAKANGLK
jgi:hypothetical protein